MSDTYLICTNNGPYVPSFRVQCVTCKTDLWQSYNAPEGIAICVECATKQMAQEGIDVAEIPASVRAEHEAYRNRHNN